VIAEPPEARFISTEQGYGQARRALGDHLGETFRKFCETPLAPRGWPARAGDGGRFAPLVAMKQRIDITQRNLLSRSLAQLAIDLAGGQNLALLDAFL
jgi:hypothetical protein